jgi:hypothetical protein
MVTSATPSFEEQVGQVLLECGFITAELLSDRAFLRRRLRVDRELKLSERLVLWTA